MVAESVAILIIGVLLLVAFLRTRHYGYAVAVIPVSIIPLFNLLARGIVYATGGGFFGIRPAVVMGFINLLGLALGCALTVFVGFRIQSKRNRGVYLGVMLAYTIILGWSYIYTSLLPIFA